MLFRSMLGLLGFLICFEFTLGPSGLLRGFVNNDCLIEFSLVGFPFKEEITGDLSSLFGLLLSFLIEGLLMASIFLSEFLLMRFFIFLASSVLIELL